MQKSYKTLLYGHCIFGFILASCLSACGPVSQEAETPIPDVVEVVNEETTVIAPEQTLFDRDNLMAWCIVPFDGQKRGPEERAEMMAVFCILTTVTLALSAITFLTEGTAGVTAVLSILRIAMIILLSTIQLPTAVLPGTEEHSIAI